VQLTIEGVKDQKQQELEGEVVLVATGRKAYTEGLGLDKVGVEVDSRGRVEVDELFRTN
jgi:dihydrolipoamide dehydrogenase